MCYREQSDRTGDLQFDWNFGTLGEEVEFAFCYPYAYEESLATHDALCAKFAAGVRAPQPPPPGAAPHPPPPKRKNTASAAPPGAVAPKETPQQADERIVLHRELLCFSVEKRRVEMLTITDAFGAAAVRESTLDPYVDVLHGAAAGSDGAPPPVDESKSYDASWLFPEARDGSSLRPEVYPDKPEVLVSARVHPGETPASFVLDGLLELLLRPDDRRAKLLRRKYVWRFVDPKPTRSCGDSADTNVPASKSAAALRRSKKWSHMRRAVQCRWLTMSTTAADPSVCSMPSWTV